MRNIPGFIGYSVDENGNVWSSSHWRGKPDRTLALFADRYGYLKVRLVVDGVRLKKTVHYLVALTYHGPKPTSEHQVRHLNGIKTDNRPENLAWGTPEENGRDKVLLRESSRGEANGQSKLTLHDVSVIKTLLDLGASQYYLASLFEIEQTAISNIARGETWKDVAAARTYMPKLLAVAEAAKRLSDNIAEFDTITDDCFLDRLYESLEALEEP